VRGGSAKGGYKRSKEGISVQNRRKYDVDVGYIKVICNCAIELFIIGSRKKENYGEK
jgi:hypothetical protein